jgi:hypothetical protein
VIACEQCELAELRERRGALWAWMVSTGRLYLDDYRRSRNPLAFYMAAYGRTMAAMLGTRPPSMYEQHRSEWVRTGDLRELRRMVRHVTRC